MVKLLEKTIKDAVEDGKCSFGSRQVLSSIKNSKLVVLSESVPNPFLQKILKAAKNSKVPILNYYGTSIELGRLCGTQFRISALALETLSDTNLKAIIKDAETEKQE